MSKELITKMILAALVSGQIKLQQIDLSHGLPSENDKKKALENVQRLNILIGSVYAAIGDYKK